MVVAKLCSCRHYIQVCYKCILRSFSLSFASEIIHLYLTGFPSNKNNWRCAYICILFSFNRTSTKEVKVRIQTDRATCGSEKGQGRHQWTAGSFFLAIKFLPWCGTLLVSRENDQNMQNRLLFCSCIGNVWIQAVPNQRWLRVSCSTNCWDISLLGFTPSRDKLCNTVYTFMSNVTCILQ